MHKDLTKNTMRTYSPINLEVDVPIHDTNGMALAAEERQLRRLVAWNGRHLQHGFPESPVHQYIGERIVHAAGNVALTAEHTRVIDMARLAAYVATFQASWQTGIWQDPYVVNGIGLNGELIEALQEATIHNLEDHPRYHSIDQTDSPLPSADLAAVS